MPPRARNVLEPLVEAHAAALYPILADPELWRYTDREPPASLEALAARYRRLEARRSPDGAQAWLNWAIVSAPDGAVGFVQATVENARAEIAYVVGAPYRGRGIATHAVHTMLDILRVRHSVRGYFATVDARNAASLRVLERLRFGLADAAVPQALRLERSAYDG